MPVHGAVNRVASEVEANPRDVQTHSAGSPAVEAMGARTSGAGTATNLSSIGPLDFFAYQRDVCERAILFWDTLRQRANNMLEHERAGLPPLLDFKSETILDARRFERPVNYELLRITESDGACWDDCVDPRKPPVIIVDPRAGHGPGIGGFKRDSEVGMALHEGHPTYFVIFFPEPCPGQTLTDVLHALRRFVAVVASRHPGKSPILYGNCQAGWALTILAADCAGLSGPVVLNGSPLSYWAGESGVNPMRIAGGLTGGAWATRFLADLGDGRFDGAWLAQNFETLKPSKAIFEKYANLFARVDSERERFLEFERWWGGYYWLSREEIVAIVENLFIGNKLEQSEIRVCEGCAVDLRRIRNPLVIFASYGDNITPPHQALGWIPAVYKNTQALKDANQRIVYLTNPHVGHLGIFVSAKVARFEHRAILSSLAAIEALALGLYEMKIDNPSRDPDGSQYAVRFEPRTVEAMHFDYPRVAFERVQQVSETNDRFYRSLISPWVRLTANPWTAGMLKWLHPMRISRYALSESFNPIMRVVSAMAEVVAKHRATLSQDHPLLEQERAATDHILEVIGQFTDYRDAAEERLFELFYGTDSDQSVSPGGRQFTRARIAASKE
jgi:hypothetical protein